MKSFEDRYAIRRVKDRLWVVVDPGRPDRTIGGSANENGARRIASLLSRLPRGPKD